MLLQIVKEDLKIVFYRGSNQTNLSGTGLGLYICKELMHKMDGDIYAQCVEGGMCFTLVMRCA